MLEAGIANLDLWGGPGGAETPSMNSKHDWSLRLYRSQRLLTPSVSSAVTRRPRCLVPPTTQNVFSTPPFVDTTPGDPQNLGVDGCGSLVQGCGSLAQGSESLAQGCGSSATNIPNLENTTSLVKDDNETSFWAGYEHAYQTKKQQRRQNASIMVQMEALQLPPPHADSSSPCFPCDEKKTAHNLTFDSYVHVHSSSTKMTRALEKAVAKANKSRSLFRSKSSLSQYVPSTTPILRDLLSLK